MYNPKDYTKIEQEILAAVGELIISKLDGRDDIAYAIFDTLVSQYGGYFPHHKVLTHLVLQHVEEDGDVYVARFRDIDASDR
jgi:hypothetical protein